MHFNSINTENSSVGVLDIAFDTNNKRKIKVLNHIAYEVYQNKKLTRKGKTDSTQNSLIRVFSIILTYTFHLILAFVVVKLYFVPK